MGGLLARCFTEESRGYQAICWPVCSIPDPDKRLCMLEILLILLQVFAGWAKLRWWLLRVWAKFSIWSHYRRVSDGRIQGTVMTALLWSATQELHESRGWRRCLTMFSHWLTNGGFTSIHLHFSMVASPRVHRTQCKLRSVLLTGALSPLFGLRWKPWRKGWGPRPPSHGDISCRPSAWVASVETEPDLGLCLKIRTPPFSFFHPKMSWQLLFSSILMAINWCILVSPYFAPQKWGPRALPLRLPLPRARACWTEIFLRRPGWVRSSNMAAMES